MPDGRVTVARVLEGAEELAVEVEVQGRARVALVEDRVLRVPEARSVRELVRNELLHGDLVNARV